MVDNVFELIGYSYDPQSQDLRLVGKNPEVNSSIELTIHNPTQMMLMAAMSTYDRRYENKSLDICLIKNAE